MELHVIIDNLPLQEIPYRSGMDISAVATDEPGRVKSAAEEVDAEKHAAGGMAGEGVAAEKHAAGGMAGEGVAAGELDVKRMDAEEHAVKRMDAEEHATEGMALCNEHGLCLHFALDGKNYLVDTGASGKALDNMDTLHRNGNSVPQAEKIDAVFISHGHNDHTGGLRKFIEQNSTAPIYLHNSIRGNYFFSSRPKNGVREARSIGMEQALFAEHQERFLEIEGVTRITEKITLIPVTGTKGYAAPMGNEFLFKNDFPDNFAHEVAILVEHAQGKYTVISPCTHNGILNVLECCTRYLSTPSCAGNGEWCQNGYFSAPSCAGNGEWCQNGHISAPDCAGNEEWCKNGHFSAPSCAGNGEWCQNGYFSAPNDAQNEKWCKNGYFSAPSCAGNEKWCQNGHFSAPNDAGNEKWCQNGHFSAPSCAENEEWCQNGHFSAPSYGKNRAADGATVGATGETTAGATGEAGGGAAGEVLSGRGEIRYFVGGLHYVDYLQGCGENKEAAQIIGTANKLRELYPGLKVFSGHCTCSAAGELLGSVLGDNYATFCTGSTIMCK